MRRRNLVIGIDLGQVFDYSALAVVERLEAENRTGLSRLTILDHYRVLWLKLWERGTDYAAVVRDTGTMMRRADIQDAPIVLDATGVGKKVVELFWQAHRLGRLGRYWPHPFVITGDREVTKELVPKKELVGVVQTALQAGRLKVVDALPLAPKLRQQMQTFEVKLSPTGQETFESARESDHDDLVIAVALAMYYRHTLVRPRQLGELAAATA